MELRRGEFFTLPSDEDLADVRILLGRITDVTSMRSIPGGTFEIFDWCTDESGELIRNPDTPVFKRHTGTGRIGLKRAVNDAVKNENSSCVTRNRS